MAQKAAAAGMAAVCAVLAATALGLQRSRGPDFQVAAGVVPSVLYTEEAFGASGVAPVNRNIASDVAADNRQPAVRRAAASGGSAGAAGTATTGTEPTTDPAAKPDKETPAATEGPADPARPEKAATSPTTVAEPTATTVRVSPAEDKRGGGRDKTTTTTATP